MQTWRATRHYDQARFGCLWCCAEEPLVKPEKGTRGINKFCSEQCQTGWEAYKRLVWGTVGVVQLEGKEDTDE